MEIDLGPEVVIKVKMGANVYELREPTMDDVEAMAEIGKDDPKAQAESFKKFLVSLGMPEDVLKTMGVIKFKKLAEGLMNPLKEGK